MCQGQLLGIPQNTALFALLGTSFGGNGQTNFALPNLQGRMPIGMGQNPTSGTNFIIGETGGAENVTLSPSQTPLASPTLRR